MAEKWRASSHPGVRFREHPSRRHGIGRDRYFAIRAQVNGRRVEEGLGWASQGWTAAEAAETLSELKAGHRKGEGPQTLGEKRAMVERERVREASAGLTVLELWRDDYEPKAKARLKPQSYGREVSLYTLWLAPRIGQVQVRDVTDAHLQAILDDMTAKGLSPRTREYALGVVHRLWKLAQRRGIVDAESPARLVARPRVNNARLRAFTPQELAAVLGYLRERSPAAFPLVLFCSRTGCRFSEAARLKWEHVDFDRQAALFTDTKNRDPREVPLPPGLCEVVQGLAQAKKTGQHVFLRENGSPWLQPPASFAASVKALGFNTDRGPREKLSFHSLRHAVATQLARRGLSVRDLQGLLGWKTASMALRYSKENEDLQRRAMQGLEQALSGETGKLLPFPGQRAAGDGE